MVKLRENLFVWLTVILLAGFCHVESAVSADSPVDNLMRVLPDNVVGFGGGSGCDYLKPAFEKSILGRIWNDPEMQSFYHAIKEQITAKVNQAGNPAIGGVVNDVLEALQLAISRPVVIGAAGKESKDGVGVYGFLLLEAGVKKERITAAIAKLEGRAGDEIVDVKIGAYTMHGPKDAGDVPGYWGWVGNYFVFALNDGEGLAIKYLKNPRSGSTYLSNVPATGDAMAMYVDFQKMADLVKQIASHENSDMGGRITAVLKELGLSNVRNAKFRAGFAGADVVGDELLEVEGPRTGLPGCLKPIDIFLFDAVDARAVSAGAVNIDVALLSETVMNAVKTAAPNEISSDIDQAISAFEADANVSLCKGLVENLAGPMVAYAMPMGAIAEAPAGGVAFIAKLKDGAGFEKNLTAVGVYAAAKSKGMFQVGSQSQSDGTVVHTWMVAPLMMAQIMPSWTVLDGRFVLASNINLCILAAKQATSKDPKSTSLRSTEVFTKLTTNLPANLVSFKYTDSRAQFSQLLMAAQQFWPMATMMAGQQGVKLPMMLPTFSEIVKDVGPTVNYSWWDSKGLRSHYKGMGIEASAGGIAGVAVGMAVLMPALARVRSLAQRVVSGTNISGLAKACIMYANDNEQGRFPPTLEKLIELDYVSAKQFESRRKPKGFSGPTYIYVVGQTSAMNPGNVLIYENPAYCREGVNAGFVDAHVEFLKRDDFMRRLEATYKRLGREMPEIKFKD